MAPANNNRALFALWGLFWLLMVVVAVGDERDDPHIRWWEPLVWEGSSCIVATCWLALQRRVSKRWNEYLDYPMRWFGKHLVWLPLIIVSFVAAVYAMRHGVYAYCSMSSCYPDSRPCESHLASRRTWMRGHQPRTRPFQGKAWQIRCDTKAPRQ